ncbi:Helix-turn-helix domain-containing protein [Bhargavaea beijingensis]|uniref:Helix-turn-helix domain-containing protein n=1 Tax=Bhargavaea beijingensis TaxID=426756 RepID=A0A1G6ZFI0_9BACL|nr:Helix-turn-helix domain-containing protein [Bhargavaea beijingensis]
MDNQIGEEFKRLRKERKMTLRELSDRSGLSVSFLSQVERGISTITFTSLRPQNRRSPRCKCQFLL